MRIPLKVKAPKFIIESNFFCSLNLLFEKYPETCRKCVAYIRLSTPQQNEHQNWKIQMNLIEKECKKHGVEIIKFYIEIVSGNSILLAERFDFYEACQMALENDAFLIAASVDRFLRPFYFDKENQFGLLTDLDIDNFTFHLQTTHFGKTYEHLKFVTVIAPDTDKRTVRGSVSKLGQKEKANKGGRPKKKKKKPDGYYVKRREFLLPHVLRWHQRGCSCREIASMASRRYQEHPNFSGDEGEKTSSSTIYEWLQKAKKKGEQDENKGR